MIAPIRKILHAEAAYERSIELQSHSKRLALRGRNSYLDQNKWK